jgi:hypothetical protein
VLFLLLLLRAGGRSLALFLLRLLLAESDDLLPVGMVSGQVEELPMVFGLTRP